MPDAHSNLFGQKSWKSLNENVDSCPARLRTGSDTRKIAQNRWRDSHNMGADADEPVPPTSTIHTPPILAIIQEFDCCSIYLHPRRYATSGSANALHLELIKARLFIASL